MKRERQAGCCYVRGHCAITALPLVLAAMLVFPALLSAGGPLKVAGVSGFNTGTAGTPLAWPQGTVLYYTDQGDLSPVLPQAEANAFVADAFSRWTSVPTAALSAT
ncbi:MAG TPA: hypothetical protein VL177_17675, partial [Terriglobales bacterium]|nr:hypothetical protein [Terriglobales bacterium]